MVDEMIQGPIHSDYYREALSFAESLHDDVLDALDSEDLDPSQLLLLDDQLQRLKAFIAWTNFLLRTPRG